MKRISMILHLVLDKEPVTSYQCISINLPCRLSHIPQLIPERWSGSNRSLSLLPHFPDHINGKVVMLIPGIPDEDSGKGFLYLFFGRLGILLQKNSKRKRGFRCIICALDNTGFHHCLLYIIYLPAMSQAFSGSYDSSFRLIKHDEI